MKWFRNISASTPMDEIKRQYFRLAKEHHPDMGGRLEDMQEINAEFDELKKHHYNIHTSASGSVYTDEREQQPDASDDAFPDLVAAVLRMGLTAEVCGRWVWISGDTKPHRNELKALGARWSHDKGLWYVRPANSKRYGRHKPVSMDSIRARYGSTSYQPREEQGIRTA